MMNIPISELTNQTIILIAQDLGCEISYPNMPVNKYMKEVWDNLRKGIDITEELKRKVEEEQKKIDEEIDRLFYNYIDELIDWLKRNYGCV